MYLIAQTNRKLAVCNTDKQREYKTTTKSVCVCVGGGRRRKMHLVTGHGGSENYRYSSTLSLISALDVGGGFKGTYWPLNPSK